MMRGGKMVFSLGLVVGVFALGCGGSTHQTVSVMSPVVLTQNASLKPRHCITPPVMWPLCKMLYARRANVPLSREHITKLQVTLRGWKIAMQMRINHWISGVRDINAKNGRILLARIGELSRSYPQRQRIMSVWRYKRASRPERSGLGCPNASQ